MQTFDYSRDKGSFKNYLFTLANNNIKKRLMRNKPRLAASGELRTLEAKGEDLQNEWRQFWIKQHLAFCLKNIQHDFSDNSVTAFKLYVLKEWDVRKVCDTLGMTANQVYLAKSRIVRRLRKALADLTGETI
jgi:RNA polymerase sigma-70 factor (ECF subfamily)